VNTLRKVLDTSMQQSKELISRALACHKIRPKNGIHKRRITKLPLRQSRDPGPSTSKTAAAAMKAAVARIRSWNDEQVMQYLLLLLLLRLLLLGFFLHHPPHHRKRSGSRGSPGTMCSWLEHYPSLERRKWRASPETQVRWVEDSRLG
jgi:hypothetical protein